MLTLRKIYLILPFILLAVLSDKALWEEAKIPTITSSWLTQTIQTISGEARIQEIKKWEEKAQFFLSLKKTVRVGLFYEDSSLFRFVGRNTPLTSRDYRPENIVAISGAHIEEAGRIGYIRSDAKTSLLEMAEAFELHFGVPLVVISGYRSADYQQRLWDLWRCSDSLCAPPGYSEHQLGLAIDIFEATNEQDYKANKRQTSYIDWMKKNGHFYWWTQSYQKWEKIDGYQVEPWHWRYVGKEMATRLKRLDWTLTEYVRFQEAIQGR